VPSFNCRTNEAQLVDIAKEKIIIAGAVYLAVSKKVDSMVQNCAWIARLWRVTDKKICIVKTRIGRNPCCRNLILCYVLTV
jgi:hypothetical protein